MRTGKDAAANRRRALIAPAMVALMVASLLGATRAAADPPLVAGPASADGVQPSITDLRASSDACGQLGFDHGVSISGNGSASVGEVTVTVSGFNSPTGIVSWSSDLPILAVYVKGGPSGNLFAYPSGDTGDEDLHTPRKPGGGFYSVGNVAACWNDAAATPDVTVQKSNTPDGAVAPGDTITYTLRVSNVGDANAAAVQVSDQIPAGVTFVPEASDPICNQAVGTVAVTCALGDIGPGATLATHIGVTVAEEHCGSIENTAHVSAANEVGSATENNDSNTVINTVGCVGLLQEELPPDLQVTKTSDVDADVLLHPGDVIHYTITVTNVGDETATGVRLVDVLPVGATGVGVPFPQFGGKFCTLTSSLPVGGVFPHTEVQCGPIPIGPGASETVTITTHVNEDKCGLIRNKVDVTAGNEPDEQVGPDNHAKADNEIACEARIHLLKTGPHHAHVGDTVTYRFTVTNTGGVQLAHIQLTDPRCDGPIALVDKGNGDVGLAVGEVWRYRCNHTIVAGEGDPVHSVAKVTGDPGEGSVSDTDGHDVDVLHPSIQLEKAASPTAGLPGATVVYTYVVTNTGDTPLFDISVDDEVGHVGDIESLAPGASTSRTFEFVLGSSPVTSVGTASGADALRLAVSDADDATVVVVAGNDGAGAGGSPFTGFGVGILGALAVVLSAVGVAFLALAGRRSPRPD